MKNDYFCGVKHGSPIGIGYFAVAFSFGIIAVKCGVGVLPATIMSLTNITSAGQFAGVTAIAASATLVEMAVLQLVINLRYMLMGFSLNQKLPQKFTLLQRSIIAFTNTDEIFAVAMSGVHKLTFPYMLGLSTLPIIGWTGGTLFGALAGEVLPKTIISALGIALYGMLISIVMPNVREEKSVRVVVFIAVVLSCLFTYVPLLKQVSSGISIVICTVVASVVGAVFFPVNTEQEGE